MLVPLLIAAVIGYFLGALPFGYIVARSRGVNIFECGSKNPGATNVRRVLGKGPGNIVFVLDALKGATSAGWPIVLALSFAHDTGKNLITIGGLQVLHRDSVLVSAVVGLAAALVGHSFSCFTRFRGGKGVATTAGGLLVLMPLVILISAALWWVIFRVSRYVSLASILAALLLPLSAYLLGKPPILIGLSGAIALFVALRHRANIVRLFSGTENKFVKKDSKKESSKDE